MWSAVCPWWPVGLAQPAKVIHKMQENGSTNNALKHPKLDLVATWVPNLTIDWTPSAQGRTRPGTWITPNWQGRPSNVSCTGEGRCPTVDAFPPAGSCYPDGLKCSSESKGVPGIPDHNPYLNVIDTSWHIYVLLKLPSGFNMAWWSRLAQVVRKYVYFRTVVNNKREESSSLKAFSSIVFVPATWMLLLLKSRGASCSLYHKSQLWSLIATEPKESRRLQSDVTADLRISTRKYFHPPVFFVIGFWK